MNIQWAVYNIVDDNIDDALKVLNDRNLVGWNLAMELCNIFDQITTTYGFPMSVALLQNDTLFRSVCSMQDASEVLFHRIKDCQEVQILGEDPYTPQQLLNNAMCLLLQCGQFTHDFEDWDQKLPTKKIWTNLKTFVKECYTCQLNASSITAGSQGYVQNIFATLMETSDDKDNDVQTVMTQMAALTTQSQIMAQTLAKKSASVAAAINQLAANQQSSTMHGWLI
jgi:hypothetical protein